MQGLSKIHALDRTIISRIMGPAVKSTLGNGTFYTLDNGGAPFKIDLMIKPSSQYSNEEVLNVRVSHVKYNDLDEGDEAFTLRKIKMFMDIDAIYLGCGAYDDVNDKSYDHYIGNTCLLRKGRQCTAINSHHIVSFKLPDGIDSSSLKYYCTVGNSAVPYGYLKTNLGYILIPGINCVKDLFFVSNALAKHIKDMRCVDEDKKFISLPYKVKTYDYD